MSEFLKPQSPLKHKDGAYIYPLTTADQVILENGNRLNTALNNMSSKPKAGFIYPLASSVVPDGFLLCDGAEYSRVQYEELFTAIGTIYGAGDGSTTFNVPNLQTRVPVGAGEGYGLGATGGEATHTLTVAEMPKHLHYYNSYQLGYPSTYSHDESYKTPVTSIGRSHEEDTNTPETHSNYAGGSQPHNNMQPYTVVNYIIATGKDTGVSVSDIVMGAQALPLEVQYGGTGATTLKDARQNLGVNARNLMDNSDFTNPVNQRGVLHWLSNGYTIDRWIIWDNNGNVGLSVVDGFVAFKGCMLQRLELDIYKTYTFAVMTELGEVICVSGVPAYPAQKSSGNVTIQITTDVSGLYTQVNIIQIDPSVNVHVKWAALYEGEYTAETLPEYQPKGYSAELAECMRYYRRLYRVTYRPYNVSSTVRYYRAPIVPPMRAEVAPTITLDECLETPINSWTAVESECLVYNSSATDFTISATGTDSSSDFAIRIDKIEISADL